MCVADNPTSTPTPTTHACTLSTPCSFSTAWAVLPYDPLAAFQ